MTNAERMMMWNVNGQASRSGECTAWCTAHPFAHMVVESMVSTHGELLGHIAT